MGVVMVKHQVVLLLSKVIATDTCCHDHWDIRHLLPLTWTLQHTRAAMIIRTLDIRCHAHCARHLLPYDHIGTVVRWWAIVGMHESVWPYLVTHALP